MRRWRGLKIKVISILILTTKLSMASLLKAARQDTGIAIHSINTFSFSEELLLNIVTTNHPELNLLDIFKVEVLKIGPVNPLLRVLVTCANH